MPKDEKKKSHKDIEKAVRAMLAGGACERMSPDEIVDFARAVIDALDRDEDEQEVT